MQRIPSRRLQPPLWCCAAAAILLSVPAAADGSFLLAQSITPAPSPLPRQTTPFHFGPPETGAARPQGALSDTFKDPDLKWDTMTAVREVLAPYRSGTSAPQSPAVARALDYLQQEGLRRLPPVRPANDLGEQLGTALQLGNKTRPLMPDLAKLSDELTLGTNASQRAAISAIVTKAGRTAPTGAEMDKLIATARAAKAATLAPSQHASIKRPDYTIQIDHSPSAGTTTVSVIAKGDDGKPERVSFGGHQASRPKADGSGLEQGVTPDPPRQITEADSDKERDALLGQWTDQDGLPWEIEGKGNTLTFTSTDRTGHRMAYQGDWSLGHAHGVHAVDNVADIGDGLPDDVKAALASTYHPPFTIELDYKPDGSKLQGVWISGQVTYSGMTHDIRIVEDPTWDKGLTLSRDGFKLASGADAKEGP